MHDSYLPTFLRIPLPIIVKRTVRRRAYRRNPYLLQCGHTAHSSPAQQTADTPTTGISISALVHRNCTERSVGDRRPRERPVRPACLRRASWDSPNVGSTRQYGTRACLIALVCVCTRCGADLGALAINALIVLRNAHRRTPQWVGRCIHTHTHAHAHTQTHTHTQ